MLPGDLRGLVLSDGTGVDLGGGTGVAHGGGTGVALGGDSIWVVEPGPPVDASCGLGVLVPLPHLEMTLNISSFWKSSLKYARSFLILSIMSVNKDLHSSTVVGMYLG